MAWLKITELCPYLLNFPSFFGHFESLAFFQNGGGGRDKPYTKAVKQDIFSQFFKSTAEVTIFQKSLAI